MTRQWLCAQIGASEIVPFSLAVFFDSAFRLNIFTCDAVIVTKVWIGLSCNFYSS